MKLALPLIALVALPGCNAEESAANRAAETNVSVAEVPAPPPPAGNVEAEPAEALIPNRFRGLWAESQQVCGVLTHDSRLVVGDNDLRYPEFVVVVEEVSAPDANSFAVKGRNKKSGEAAEAHFSLDVTGNILTDEVGGGTTRVRCG